MAKLERHLHRDFSSVLAAIDQGILAGSISASFEDGSTYQDGDFRCATRVYERYSWFGNNRVSLTVTLVGRGEDLFLSGITAGGSQAVFWKVNTLGEEAFLEKLQEIVDAL